MSTAFRPLSGNEHSGSDGVGKKKTLQQLCVSAELADVNVLLPAVTGDGQTAAHSHLSSQLACKPYS